MGTPRDPIDPMAGAGAAALHAALPITLVTVTYGRRWHLLQKVLQAGFLAGARKAIVVSNGATEDIASLAEVRFGTFVQVVALPSNIGSAGGFKAGIEAAVDSEAEYLFIVDDDNAAEVDCLAHLLQTYERWIRDDAARKLIVQAYRRRQFDMAAGIQSIGMHGGNVDAFFGFHWLDLPMKILRRLPVNRSRLGSRTLRPEVVLHDAPYSGMFFHRSLVDLIGLPDERFVLYCDDVEYSSRLVRLGGKIVMTTGAKLVDLEDSWDSTSESVNSFDSRLSGDGDFRAYYSARNTAFFEKYLRGAPGRTRLLNRVLFFSILFWRALLTSRLQRFRLIRRAVDDGEKGRLGVSRAFPLEA